LIQQGIDLTRDCFNLTNSRFNLTSDCFNFQGLIVKPRSVQMSAKYKYQLSTNVSYVQISAACECQLRASIGCAEWGIF
jgi:hypothetical protein